jgi:LPXTG-motif cell wall-anchored protein
MSSFFRPVAGWPLRRRGPSSGLSLRLVTALASVALILVSGASPASASHDPSAAPVLNVTKIGFGSEGNTYDFTISPVVAPADAAGAFTVADEATVRFPGLTAGQAYTITETTAGVTPDIVCSHPGSVVFDASVTFTPVAGEVVNCTFTNPDGPANGATPPEVNITKITEGGPAGTVFPFSLEGATTTAFELQGLGTESFVDPAPRPGTSDFVITEVLPPNWVLEHLLCNAGSITFTIVDGVVRVTAQAPAPGEYLNCTFHNRFVSPPPPPPPADDDDDPYDTYDDDPGDPDFVFDTPFDNAGDPASPAPTGDVAGTNAGATQQPSAEQLAVAGNTGGSQPAATGDTAPAALDELPRTGPTAAHLTLVGGLFVILGGVTTVVGRRRKALQP